MNIGISLGLDEGMDLAGQKIIGVSKKTSFADDMSFDDAKLDEYIALSKVDTDAVAELRAKEAVAQESFITSKNSIGGSGSASVLDNANYAQKIYSNIFSPEGISAVRPSGGKK